MIDLDAIKARLAAATPGPWERSPGYDEYEVRDAAGNLIAVVRDSPPLVPGLSNAALISNAPTDLAGLVGEVERQNQIIADMVKQRTAIAREAGMLSAEVERLRGALERVSRTPGFGTYEPGPKIREIHEIARAALRGEEGSE